jgi:hypothetical protein
LEQILGLSDEGVAWAVYSSQPLSALVQSFTKTDHHRVLVRLDTKESPAERGEQQEYHLVSQSDLIRYIYNELFQDFTAEFGSISISKILAARETGHVVKLNDGMTALACFKVCFLLFLTP